MILIAESGSTKTDWVIINGKEVNHIYSEGYNPYYMETEYIENSINMSFTNNIEQQKITKIYFYGAGCSSEQKYILEKALKACFTEATIVVESDMLAAARGLLGKKAGFAAILGTGTNTCYYNGSEIIETVDSLGFLAGDEGSGAYLGKKIIKAYLRGYLPNHLESDFENTFEFNKSNLIKALYDSITPNKFAAQFAIFAGKHINDEFIKELVRSSFNEFFKEIMINYNNYKNNEICFIGSIAFVFSEILESVALEFDMKVGKINKSPLANLIKHHTIDVQEN
jgi:N-acetylglucosamine kinase-like BadF-type ATPase